MPGVSSSRSERIPGRNRGGDDLQMQHSLQQRLHENLQRGARYASVQNSVQQI